MDRRYSNKMFSGLILVVAGIVFLLHQFGMVEFNIGYLFSTFWPVFIIIFALSGLLFQTRHGARGGSYIWNFFTLLLGVYFLLINLGVDGFSYGNMYKFLVPSVLIIAGISMFFKKPYSKYPGNGESRYHDDYRTTGSASEYRAPDASEAGYSTGQGYSTPNRRPGSYGTVNRSGFFGDTHLGQDYWELTPLNISHFIGDTVIDLTKASIPYGETHLNVSAFIGDVRLYVPFDVQVGVEVSSNCLIGEAKVLERKEGGFFTNVKIQSPNYFDAEKKIRLTASSFIGDVTVTRVG